MQGFQVSLRFGVWNFVETIYTTPTSGLSFDDEVKAYENNFKARYALLRGLSNMPNL